MASAQAENYGRRTVELTKYEVREELGHGGMATVFRAHDPRLGRDVAVKVLHPHLRESHEVAHRFSVEARAVAKLRHPNIVEVYDVSDENDPEQYLVVELVRGVTLRKLLREAGPLPPEVGAALAIEILEALEHAHASGIVHRDVKPENVLLEHHPAGDVPTSSAAEGARTRVKLTDFGIAKMLDAQGVTSTGQVLGSPAHMAPEQIEGRDVDARADVFGVGVLLYEAIVGHLPFEGQNPAQVLRKVLDGLYAPAERERGVVGRAYSSLVDQALAREPEDRLRSAAALRDGLAAELSRLGFEDPKSELTRFLDEREAYVAAEAERLVPRLCALGREASRRGDAIAAAGDFNRALAYRPDDAELCRVVAGLRRAEARRRALRRFVPPLAGVLVLATVGYGAARGLRRVVVPPDPRPAPVASLAEPALPSPAPPEAGTDEPPVGRPAPRPVVVATQVPPRPVARVKRALELTSVRPPNGVKVRVDGEAFGDAVSGGRLELDERPHEIVFGCAFEMCEPEKRYLPAGDRGDTWTVALKIRDAVLVVDGDPTKFYGIEQAPNLTLRSGAPARVPMTRGTQLVVVIERDSGRRQSVQLRAGQEARAAFP